MTSRTNRHRAASATSRTCDECVSQAREAAGDGDVMVHGAGAAQALLRAGQLDELELHVVPVLLGQGRRLFDNLPAEHVELDLVRRLTTPADEEQAKQVLHLRYRVLRAVALAGGSGYRGSRPAKATNRS